MDKISHHKLNVNNSVKVRNDRLFFFNFHNGNVENIFGEIMRKQANLRLPLLSRVEMIIFNFSYSSAIIRKQG